MVDLRIKIASGGKVEKAHDTFEAYLCLLCSCINCNLRNSLLILKEIGPGWR